MNNYPWFQSYFTEMVKLALPRQLKIVQKLLREGDKAGAEKLLSKLHASGTLKVTDQGSQLSRLGSGAEGVAHSVAGTRVAPKQVAVRKTFDRDGPLYSKEMLSEKMQAGRKLRGDDRFAELLSKRVGKGKRGGRYLHYEHVAGKTLEQAPAKGAIQQGTDAVAVARMSEALKGRGGRRALLDIQGNAGNVVRTPQGKLKALDYLPAPAKDVADVNRGAAPFQRRLQAQMGATPAPQPPRPPTHREGIRGKANMLAYQARLKAHGLAHQKWQQDLPQQFARAPQAQQRNLDRKAPAALFRHLYKGPTAPSDMTAAGLRRANSRRALQAL